jgi:ribosomal protein S27E
MAVLLIASTIALAISAMGLVRYEVLFSWSIWSAVLGLTGVFASIFGAMLVRCHACRKRALVFQEPGGEAGNTIAIFDTRACHHCGAKL